MFLALEKVMDELQHNLPRAVIITGAGKEAFCAGFDINPENPMVADCLKKLDGKDLNRQEDWLNG